MSGWSECLFSFVVWLKCQQKHAFERELWKKTCEKGKKKTGFRKKENLSGFCQQKKKESKKSSFGILPWWFFESRVERVFGGTEKKKTKLPTLFVIELFSFFFFFFLRAIRGERENKIHRFWYGWKGMGIRSEREGGRSLFFFLVEGGGVEIERKKYFLRYQRGTNCVVEIG